jgi:non-ribosomal peptide synthetase-like protein
MLAGCNSNTSKIHFACLHEFFEARADEQPLAAALVYETEVLTYQELEARANRLAHHLRVAGAAPGMLIGIYLERSADPFVAILAVLKTGAAYVPIDPGYPEERVHHILSDAAVGLLVTQRSLADRARPALAGAAILVDENAAAIACCPATRLPKGAAGVTPEDLCYVIYTSGSTGRPKGVMIEHRSAVNFVHAIRDVYGITPADRVYQGFSLAFDAAVEEVWGAFAAGAALVVGTDSLVRSPAHAAHFLTTERVTVFSTVPTFLAMMEHDLPAVRLLILGGEPCPADLVTRWARPGRRMLNTYGPTEATVVTTWAECLPGRPVMIGWPLSGYEVRVLDERLEPVPPGEAGELCIAGVGLARGYLNLPELTVERFVTDPSADPETLPMRLYRTHDRVRLLEGEGLQFLGRTDDQVKIRGFRIELSEIETVLLEHPHVRTAAVRVVECNGLQEIAAYVVPADTGAAFDRSGIADLLRARLPEYMVPGHLDLLNALPMMPSGKVDRRQLPPPVSPLLGTERVITAPRSELERRIACVWQEALGSSTVSIDDDFFFDLRAHSLLVARTVSLLRRDLPHLEISARDIYRHRTIRCLAEHLAAAEAVGAVSDPEPAEAATRLSSRTVFASVPRWVRASCIGLQACSLYLLYLLGTLPLTFVGLKILEAFAGQVPVATAAVSIAGLLLLTWPLALASSIVGKWLVIGRYREGRYPVWSLYYFRWWLANALQAMSGAGLLRGTPLMSLYYRAMGADIGRGCTIDTVLCSAFDLVTIGEDSSIGAETHLLGYRIEDGMLILGRVDIGARCFVGVHCCLGLDTIMGDDARLDDLSLLADGELIEPGGSYRGSPIQPAVVTVPPPAVPGTAATRSRRRLFAVLHLLAIYGLGLVMLLTMLPSLSLILYTLLTHGHGWAVLSIFAAVPVGILALALGAVAIKRLLLGRVQPGTYAILSGFYLRKWVVDLLLDGCRSVLMPVYATLYLPPWLRLLGARIGKRVEISTVSQIAPDLLVAGDESFFADGTIIGGRRTFRGRFMIAENRVGARSFLGNSALLPVGAAIGNGCLVGVLSAPPANADAATRDTSWLGSPAFELPRRQTETCFDEQATYRPSAWMYAQRLVIDGLRILVPGTIVATALLLFIAWLLATHERLAWPTIFILTPVVAFGLAVAAALAVAMIKTVLMGRYRPTVQPLWSMYVWLNELVNGAYEAVAAPALSPLLGTPFLAWYLRLLGCRIGRHVYLGSTLLSEFDLVEIGDYAAVNVGATIQTHLFEDRIMKASHLRIGDECSIGNMAVVLYDTEMQRGASLGPLSLLMKGETLPAFSHWVGIPTRASAAAHDRLQAGPIVYPKMAAGLPAAAAASPLRFAKTPDPGTTTWHDAAHG